jgi:hypothetical protein
MKRNFIYILTAAAAISFSACSNDGGKEGSGADSTKTAEGSASADASVKKGKYPVKSGIVTYDTETMGMKMPTTLYFDDYGNKECTEVNAELEMMGQKVKTHNVTITRDGYTYTLDMEQKTGTKMKVPTGGADPKNMDFSSLSEEMMKQMHMAKGANENVLGKECSVFTMDNPDMKMKGTFAVWNNIPLKSNIDMGGMAIIMNASKVEENASVPADKFEIPKDIKLTEY